MKKLFLAFIFIFTTIFSYGQNENPFLDINYGVFKTTYMIDDIAVSKKVFKNTIKKNELANKQFRQGNTMMTTGGVLGVPGIVLLVLTIENQNKGNTPYAWQWIGGIGGGLTGTILYYSGRKKTLNGVDIFNDKQKLSLELNTKDGIGLVLRF